MRISDWSSDVCSSDLVVHQEALVAFRGVGRQPPRAAALADRVPGPYRVRLHVGRELRLHGDAAVVRGDGDPVLIGDAMPGAGARVPVQVVARGDLPPPRVLRTPRVVHEHRTPRAGEAWDDPKLVW